MEDNTNLNTETNSESNSVDSNKETTNNVATDNKTDDKTFTQEEVDKIIEKRLARALKKAEDDKLEAEKLAKMSEAERQQTLFEKEKAKFEDERKQHQREKLELQVTKELANKELPTSFAKYLIADSAEDCMSNIKEFEVNWQQAIEKAISSKLKGSTPKAGSGVQTSTSSSDGFINIIKQNQAKR